MTGASHPPQPPHEPTGTPPAGGSPWTDLERPPLRGRELDHALTGHGGLWREIDVVAETGSTNADLAARAAEPEGLVRVAEYQSAGRGRLDRAWTAPPRSGLFLSVLLRPTEVPVAQWGWLPLLVGVAAAESTSRVAGLDVRLKWPNDLLIGDRKLAGILAERAGDGVVVGIGLNVTLAADELPVPTATSLGLENSITTDRDPLLRALLRDLEAWYTRWREAGGDARSSGLHSAYTAACATLGRRVRVELPAGRTLIGTATAIDNDGRVVVEGTHGPEAVGAGDVIHVRPADDVQM
ncbi:biotin--[acetyl-CoA-carboxylase] ligase [Yinghuangia seranimata]|uniref:biotin--[acetyl-CoA-carboxylase] ligase n=1 Tax=Yinghuangia seranimata TaxID=408067 RepID=UPI00248CAFF5|nr:biotin--[acetyl-CoA-carboxylase] ligase [Yinghuangia seranimata]MDI2130984.1 biotin--[acetyl-CoA-carboxylase] ligase [Yinghuangia seranimata]